MHSFRNWARPYWQDQLCMQTGLCRFNNTALPARQSAASTSKCGARHVTFRLIQQVCARESRKRNLGHEAFKH